MFVDCRERGKEGEKKRKGERNIIQLPASWALTGHNLGMWSD